MLVMEMSGDCGRACYLYEPLPWPVLIEPEALFAKLVARVPRDGAPNWRRVERGRLRHRLQAGTEGSYPPIHQSSRVADGVVVQTSVVSELLGGGDEGGDGVSVEFVLLLPMAHGRVEALVVRAVPATWHQGR